MPVPRTSIARKRKPREERAPRAGVHFTWSGKEEALALVAAPPLGKLVRAPEEPVNAALAAFYERLRPIVASVTVSRIPTYGCGARSSACGPSAAMA